MRLRLFLVLLAARAAAASQVQCPDAAVSVFVNNLSADAAVSVMLDGNLLPDAVTCDDGGATTYQAAMECHGTGLVACGQVSGLRPGSWVHRLHVTVSGSDSQRQARRLVLVGGSPNEVTNTLAWTVYPHTAVVAQPTEAALRARLADAATGPRPALVTFAPDAFPPGQAQQIVVTSGHCTPEDVASLCLMASDLVVDALDTNGEPGAVTLTTDDRARLVRVYGSDDVLRGLVLRGSQTVTNQADTVTVEPGAHAVRIEHCMIHGPILGDGIEVGGNVGDPSADATVVATEISGAEDKGMKVTAGSAATVQQSCIHDNGNGGIQATLGGTVTANENVVQHNLDVATHDAGTSAENGLLVGVPRCMDSQALNVLMTQGNVIRFNGQRGISVVNNATAVLRDDVVTDNYHAGLLVETTHRGRHATAQVRGSLFACNYAPGICGKSSGAPACRDAAECAGCMLRGDATGVGAKLDEATCLDDSACQSPDACEPPTVDLGQADDEPEPNAFTLNRNPLPPRGQTPIGVNLDTTLTLHVPTPAAGNQWEHCDVPRSNPTDPEACNMPQVMAQDVRQADARSLDLGMPLGPRYGAPPMVSTVSPPRPHAGEMVRVFGGPFDAIDGTACSPPGLPTDLCSVENANTAAKNATALGNHVTVTIAGVSHDAEVHQVTPSMLIFRMPVDCYVDGTVVVTRGSEVGLPGRICGPQDCTNLPPGAPCDDGDACTIGDTCDGTETCVGTAIPGCVATTTTSSTSSTSSSTSTSTSSTSSSTLTTTTTSTLPAGSTSSTSLSTTSVSTTLVSTTTSSTSTVSTSSTRPPGPTTSTTLPCPASGLVECLCKRGLVVLACSGQRVPRAVTRPFSRACAWAGRLVVGQSSTAKQQRWCGRAGQLFAHASHVVAHRRRQHLTAPCVEALRQLLDEAKGGLPCGSP